MFNIKTDSRKVKKGDIFVALKEYSSDGHDYINQAIKNGAKTVVCEYGTYEVETIKVEDTRKYLKKYLEEHYQYLFDKLKIIGITGTNGKTTEAYMLHKALNLAGKKAAYIGTIGFYINEKVRDLTNTTNYLCDNYELFFEAYNLGCEYVVMEVSSQGIAHKRTEGILFDAGIFTNLTQDHLDYHHTMENYMNCKVEMFKNVKENGFTLINNDDQYKEHFMIHPRTYTYGFSESDYKIVDYKTNELGTSVSLIFKGKIETIQTLLVGEYNVYNIIVIIGTLDKLGFQIELIKKIIPLLEAPKGRMELIKYNTNKIIVDYAHTPDAMEKTIQTVKKVIKGNTYVVFGCTGDRDRDKRPKMMNIATSLCKYVIITNDDPHYENPEDIVKDMLSLNAQNNYEVILNRKDAIEKGIELLKEEDALLILGKGHETNIIIKDKKIPFNDREVVDNYLKNK